MRLRRFALVIAILFSNTLAISPAYGGDNHPVPKVGGTVWVDENADGIRQPSERVLPGALANLSVWSWNKAGYRALASGARADNHGKYTRRISYRTTYVMSVYHFEPGTEPVRETSWGTKYTHFGCASFFVPRGATETTVNIRVLKNDVLDDNEGDPPLVLPPRSWPLVDGRFFNISTCDSGYSITNADEIPFWDTWQRLGLEHVGYPRSHRFVWNGFVTQIFQNAIFQWQPGRGVFLINIFDELHDSGKDQALHSRWSIPEQLPPSFDVISDYVDPTLVWGEIQRRRLALLDANPAIKKKYYSAPDPLLLYGLPTSRVEDYGNVFVLRTQRAVFRQWKKEVSVMYQWQMYVGSTTHTVNAEGVSGAMAGEVTMVQAGTVAKLVGWTCVRPFGATSSRCVHLFFPDWTEFWSRIEELEDQHVDLVDKGETRDSSVP